MAALAAIGTIVSAGASVIQGVQQKKADDYQAQQLNQQADASLASSQREAQQSRHEAALANSRAQALAAASGGGAGSDAPTIVKLMSGIAGQGQYNADANLYSGLQQASGLNAQATAARQSGNSSLLGGVLGGFGQAASGVGKYGTSKGWWS